MSDDDHNQLELAKDLIHELWCAETYHAIKLEGCKTIEEIQEEAHRHFCRLSRLGNKYMDEPDVSSLFRPGGKPDFK